MIQPTASQTILSKEQLCHKTFPRNVQQRFTDFRKWIRNAFSGDDFTHHPNIIQHHQHFRDHTLTWAKNLKLNFYNIICRGVFAFGLLPSLWRCKPDQACAQQQPVWKSNRVRLTRHEQRDLLSSMTEWGEWQEQAKPHTEPANHMCSSASLNPRSVKEDSFPTRSQITAQNQPCPLTSQVNGMKTWIILPALNVKKKKKNMFYNSLYNSSAKIT